MYDIPELEKKWKKYKREQIKKPIIYSLVTLLIVGGLAYIIPKFLHKEDSNLNTSTSNLQNKEVKKENNKEEKAIIISKTPMENSENSNENNNEAEIDLSNATIVKPNVPEDEIRVIGFDKEKQKEVENKYKDIINSPDNVSALEKKIDPIVKEYEDRFKETQDPQDSLYLAKYFYKKGNFAKAEIWAINTNNIDGDIEESWLIFAKARAKQGHRVEAIKILQEYYDNTSSPKAKELLDKLRRNKPFE